MSSLRVRAQNKLLSKLGAAKPSKNVQFDNAHANFERAHDSVMALDSALRGFIVSLKGFHLSAQVLYGAIEAIGGAPDNSPEMKQTVAELKNAFVHVDVTALEDSVKKFENRVQRPATGWMGRATAIKQQVAEFNEEKLVYDHYTRKVMGLREARDKRSAAGKSEKPKDVEKIVRNEQKLAASTNSYAKLSDTTVTSLREFVNTREATLAPIIQRVLEFRVQYAARIADESRILQKMMRQDSAFDSMLGSLESFASKFSTSGSSGGTGSGDHADTYSASPSPSQEPPELPVKALSFESFVGEAPPPPPVAASASANARTASQEWLPAEMPALPTPPNAFGAPYATAPTPPAPAAMALSPTSLTSANAFFDDHFGSMPSSPQTQGMAAFQTAPMPTIASVSSSSGSLTPWDDIPPPPPPTAQQVKSGFGSMAAQLNTMPVSPTAPPAQGTFGWDSFGESGGMTDFQHLHQQNAMN